MKIRRILLAVAVLLMAFGMQFSFAAEEPPAQNLEISYQNIAFQESVYLMYAVPATTETAPEVLVWRWDNIPADGGFTHGTESSVLTARASKETIGGVEHWVYTYPILAKNMADYVYARAYADGNYGDVKKMSVVEFAARCRTKTTLTQSYLDLLDSTLNYGASAQKYFGYNIDRLANGGFNMVSVEGGTMSDGATEGLYKTGDSISINAPQTNSAGVPFGYWLNNKNEIVGYTANATVTMGTTYDTYRAVYRDMTVPSEGLTFELNDDDKSYSVTGIGTCTDFVIIIPSMYDNKPVSSIAKEAFLNADMSYVTIPISVQTIDYAAFAYCTNLKEIYLHVRIERIEAGTFQGCTSLTTIRIADSVKYISETAFADCTGVTAIYYEGTAEQWASVNAEQNWDIDFPDTCRIYDINEKAFDGLPNVDYNIATEENEPPKEEAKEEEKKEEEEEEVDWGFEGLFGDENGGQTNIDGNGGQTNTDNNTSEEEATDPTNGNEEGTSPNPEDFGFDTLF